jgi:hypothetical protein
MYSMIGFNFYSLNSENFCTYGFTNLFVHFFEIFCSELIEYCNYSHNLNDLIKIKSKNSRLNKTTISFY